MSSVPRLLLFTLPIVFAACASTPPAVSDAASVGADAQGPVGGPSLREAAAAKGLLVGAALSPSHFGEPLYKTVAGREFNALTPENEMKWVNTEPQRGRFAFGPGDALVQFARDNDMKVRGHALVWYQAIPSYLEALPADELRTAMLDHIKAVATHWKGQVYAWDVVNEAIEDGSSGMLRRTSVFAKLGPSYLDEAFRAAHEADPEALLFYNDYDGEAAGSAKSEAIFALVKRLKESGVPISGVGLQSHLDPRRLPDYAAVKRNMERLVSLGLTVNISELDVPVGAIDGDMATKLGRQAEIYDSFVGTCLQTTGCTGVTLWGFTDKHSWLNIPEFAQYRGTGPHMPLLFDDAYNPKPSYVSLRTAIARN
ncbi:MAG: endo-1,4-beta-xylanase [Deltaproteobacteria bacterium]|nr:endo-1,4-beta-xylanase [Deltaproteobacteria bacterium]